MISQKHLSIVEAWNELNKALNKKDLLETLVAKDEDISASKTKEVLIQCSIINNDKSTNRVISKDSRTDEIISLEETITAWEKYIRNEIKILKLTEPVICVAFLKEYYLNSKNKRMTWEEIAKEVGYSVRQVKRFYYEDYKGQTPSDNSWFNEDGKMTKIK